MTAETTITGASDDLIEIDGQIREEFPHNPYDNDSKEALLAFSDGTLLGILYDSDGIWRVKRLVAGTCDYRHQPGDVVEDRPDVATLVGDVRWCVYAARSESNPAMAS